MRIFLILILLISPVMAADLSIKKSIQTFSFSKLKPKQPYKPTADEIRGNVKPDEHGRYFYKLNAREKKIYGDNCFHQPLGFYGALPETCKKKK